jgi:hypothetical protein
METEPMSQRSLFNHRGLCIFVACVVLSLSALAVEPDVETSDTNTADSAVDVPASPAAIVKPHVTEQPATSSAAELGQDLLAKIEERPEEPPPFDFAPYRVLVWIAADDPRVTAESLESELMDFLDRDFHSIWRTVIADAPPAVASVARRNLSSITFDTIAASDPVIALKKGHEDSLRINFASDAGRFLKEIPGTRGLVQDITARVQSDPEFKTTPAKFEWIEKLRPIDGDAMVLKSMWHEQTTAAILVSRGMAETLDDPKAKLIVPPLRGQIVDAIEQFDKIYIARLQTDAAPATVEVIELDTLMRHFGDVTKRRVVSKNHLGVTVASAVRETFAPVVRIDNAGQKDAVGLIRAAGLALDPESPALIRVGDVLEPLVRKEDRNGNPMSIGPLDWAYLITVENELAAFGTTGAKEILLGDSIETVAGKEVDSPHVIQRTLKDITSSTIEVEIQRGDKPQQLTVTKSDVPVLQPQYFGVLVRERTVEGKNNVVVTEVLEDSPADGQLKVDDVLKSIGKMNVESAKAISKMVVTTPDSPTVEITVQRGDTTETIKLTPNPISNRIQQAPHSVNMDFYAGRMGGLQGRKNNRIHRMAIRVKPRLDNTLLRLHAKGKPNDPLIGYEIYGKELDSSSMTFVGRTDWNGRLDIDKIDRPLRLLYVKNGGAVLARLPMVPGHHALAVADLEGDDMRLQAEAYIRGVQNAIVDLVAVRELFKARVLMRLKEGNLRDANELLEMLRSEPSNEVIANDMGKKQTMFLKAIGRNPNQQRKVDEMFSTTRELLSKQINPKMINDLEAIIIAVKEGKPVPAPPAAQSPAAAESPRAAEVAPAADPPPAAAEPAADTQ